MSFHRKILIDNAYLKNILSFANIVIIDLNTSRTAFINDDNKQKIIAKLKSFAKAEVL